MNKLAFTRSAVADLQRLKAFIQQKDASAAERTAASLLNSIQLLRDFPQLGVKVLGAYPVNNLRDYIHKDYIVRYRWKEGVVVVLRVWHGRENRPENRSQ